MTQILLNSLLALLPVLAFLLLYRSYSVFPSGPLTHAFHFLSGLVGASVLLLLSRFIAISLGHWGTAFLLAALPERIMVFFLIALSPARIHRRGSLAEMIMAGILIGLGFATMENLAYGLRQGYQIAFLRLMIPVPLHAAMGAFSACGLGLAILHRHPLYRWLHFFASLAIPVILHGLVDGFLFSGWDVLAGLLLVLILVRLEYLIARTRATPPVDVLEALGMTYEDWLLVQGHAGYERSLMGASGNGFLPAPLFRLRWSAARMIAVSLLILVPLAYSLFASPDLVPSLTLAEQRLVFILFPLFLSGNVLLVGVVNPEVLQRGGLPMHQSIRLHLPTRVETIHILRPFGCFVPTPAPFRDSHFTARLEKESRVSPCFETRVSWQSHGDSRQQSGSVLLFESLSFRTLVFFLSVYLCRKPGPPPFGRKSRP